MKAKFLLLLLLSTFTIAGFAQTQTKEVYMAATPAMVESLLKAKNIKYEDIKDGDYTITLGEYNVVISIAEGDLGLKTFYSDKPAIKKVNAFNFKYSFGRVFLDDDKELVLSSELDFAGGVTKEGFYSFLETFQMLLDRVSQEMG